MASAYLSRTPSSTGNRKLFTFSCWLKRASLGADGGIFNVYENDNNYFRIRFNADNLQVSNVDSGSTTMNLVLSRLQRDVNGYYHLVVAYDSAQSTTADRCKIYTNGVLETSLSTSTYPSQNANTFTNLQFPTQIGRSRPNNHYFNGQMAHVHFVDGTAYTPSTFGETDTTTGIWKPKTSPTGINYGTNGFFLKMDNSGNMGLDSSGQSNNLTTSGTIIQTKDTPSNVFATSNPLSSRFVVHSSINNNIFFDETGQWRAVYSTLGASSGKYYMEAKVDAVGGEASIGVIPAERASQNQDTGDYLGKETDSIGYLNNGRTFKSNSQLQTGLTAMTSGTIVGIALDLDNNTVQFYNNNSAVGNAIATTAGTTYLFGFSGYSDTRFYANFGNGYFNTTAVASAENPDDGIGIFEYDPPTGYRALCTKSLNAEEYS